MNDFAFSIRLNNAAVKEHCPITDTYFTPDIGFWVFVDWDKEPVPVSKKAMREKAPLLSEALSRLNGDGDWTL